ncbi:Breast cancer 2 susceptibility protein [Fasciola gigantica]|uniref:Breast cancer 2 susceptibility protein n=1 Tax=Fasciola gigantica TaxID=46835 RepID=A0A504YFM6_FASGI|nr:Breast cancer 2 susceptibility protein [Fasciola gigantica]
MEEVAPCIEAFLDKLFDHVQPIDVQTVLKISDDQVSLARPLFTEDQSTMNAIPFAENNMVMVKSSFLGSPILDSFSSSTEEENNLTEPKFIGFIYPMDNETIKPDTLAVIQTNGHCEISENTHEFEDSFPNINLTQLLAIPEGNQNSNSDQWHVSPTDTEGLSVTHSSVVPDEKNSEHNSRQYSKGMNPVFVTAGGKKIHPPSTLAIDKARHLIFDDVFSSSSDVNPLDKEIILHDCVDLIAVTSELKSVPSTDDNSKKTNSTVVGTNSLHFSVRSSSRMLPGLDEVHNTLSTEEPAQLLKIPSGANHSCKTSFDKTELSSVLCYTKPSTTSNKIVPAFTGQLTLISDAALQKAKSLFASVESSGDGESITSGPSVVSGSAIGFVSASGRQLAPISDAALQKAKSLFASVESSGDGESITSGPSVVSGSAIGFKAKSLFASVESSGDGESITSGPSVVSGSAIGFVSASGRQLAPISDAALQKAKSLFASVESSGDGESITSGPSVVSGSAIGFVSASGRQLAPISEIALQKTKNGIVISKNPAVDKPNQSDALNSQVASIYTLPTFNKESMGHVNLVPVNGCDLSKALQQREGFVYDENSTQNVSHSGKKASCDSSVWDGDLDTGLSLTDALEQNNNLSDIGSDGDSLVCLMEKSQFRETVQAIMYNHGLHPSDSNAFLASPGVSLRLVSRDWLEHHYDLIVWKLGCTALRFSSLEQGPLPADYFSPHHVLLRLRYRYDRELDAAERPALRRIVELDDTPARRLVLCVSELDTSDTKLIKARLTDGWYQLVWQLDPSLARLIRSRRIRVGSKLVTAGAELVSVDSVTGASENARTVCTRPGGSGDYNHGHLFESDGAAVGVALKLHGNSTRPVPWYMKLGFTIAQPKSGIGLYPVALSSLEADGGLCVAIRVVIQVSKFLSSQRRKQPTHSELSALGNDGEALFSAVMGALDPPEAEADLSDSQRDAIRQFKETALLNAVAEATPTRKASTTRTSDPFVPPNPPRHVGCMEPGTVLSLSGGRNTTIRLLSSTIKETKKVDPLDSVDENLISQVYEPRCALSVTDVQRLSASSAQSYRTPRVDQEQDLLCSVRALVIDMKQNATLSMKRLLLQTRQNERLNSHLDRLTRLAECHWSLGSGSLRTTTSMSVPRFSASINTPVKMGFSSLVHSLTPQDVTPIAGLRERTPLRTPARPPQSLKQCLEWNTPVLPSTSVLHFQTPIIPNISTPEQTISATAACEVKKNTSEFSFFSQPKAEPFLNRGLRSTPRTGLSRRGRPRNRNPTTATAHPTDRTTAQTHSLMQLPPLSVTTPVSTDPSELPSSNLQNPTPLIFGEDQLSETPKPKRRRISPVLTCKEHQTDRDEKENHSEPFEINSPPQFILEDTQELISSPVYSSSRHPASPLRASNPAVCSVSLDLSSMEVSTEDLDVSIADLVKTRRRTSSRPFPTSSTPTRTKSRYFSAQE